MRLTKRHSFLMALMISSVLWTVGCEKSGADTANRTETGSGQMGDENWASGKWKLIGPNPQNSQQEVSLAVFQVNPDEEGEKALTVLTALEGTPFETVVGESVSVEDDELDITFQMGEDRTMRLNGKHHGGFVLAGMRPVGSPYPARLYRLDKVGDSAIDPKTAIGPIPGVESIKEMSAKSDKLPTQLKSFVKKHPKSALPISLGKEMLSDPTQFSVGPEAVEKIDAWTLKESTRWGSMVEDDHRLDVIQQLLRQRRNLSLVESVAAGLKERDADSLPPGYDTDRVQNAITSVKAIEKYRSASADEKDAAFDALVKLDEESDFNADLTWEIAQAQIEKENKQDAIDRLVEIMANPGAEQRLLVGFRSRDEKPEMPMRQLFGLWREVHGDLDGLDEHLAEVWHETALDFVPQPESKKKAEPQQQMAVVELFTGGSCPPCVAADLATAAAEKTYDASQLVVLRYHQHIPGHTALVSPESEKRFVVYDGRGTPSVYLNGEKLEEIGGGYPFRTDSWEELQQALEPAFSNRTNIELSVDTTQVGNDVEWSIEASSLPEEKGDYRLFAVVAEKRVLYRATNGVMSHEMLVRDILEDPQEGLELSAGQLAHSGTYSLSGLHEDLKSYLEKVEDRTSRAFSQKPLDLKDLKLVVLLQDMETRKIYQTAVHEFGSYDPEFKEDSSEAGSAEEQQSEAGPDKKAEPKPVTAPVPMDESTLNIPGYADSVPVVFQEEGDAEEEAAEEKEPEPRATVGGRWLVVLLQRGRQTPIALVDISKGDAQWLGEFLESPRGVSPLEMNDFVVRKETTVEADFELQKRLKIAFRGKFRDGFIPGVIRLGDAPPPRLAFMAPVPDAGLREILPEFKSTPEGFGEFQKATRSDDPLADLDAFAKAYPNSPLTTLIFPQVVELASRSDKVELTDKELKARAQQLIESANRWHPELGMIAHYQIAEVLTDSGMSLDFAEASLASFESSLEKPDAAAWEESIKEVRENIAVARLKVKLQEGTEEEQQAAAESLAKLENADGAEIRYLLADYFSRTGELKKALDQFGALAVEPGADRELAFAFQNSGKVYPTAAKRAEELLKELQPKSDVPFEEYLSEKYHDLTASLVKKPEVAGNPGRTRTTLVELFTGAMCPPCVAADLATGAIEQAYSQKELIVVRYHMHIPGPDPLANADTEARFGMYPLRGTPSIVINGRPEQRGGGGFSGAAEVRDWLMETIEKEPAESPITLVLSANAKDQQIMISAAAETEEALPKDAVLRLLLCEEQFEFTARNGIRSHEMVVRDMVPTPKGIAAEDGTLAWEGTVSLLELKRGLVDYLDNFEKKRRFQFSAKPLDLTKLHLVAIVQKGDAGEVLATSRVPVSGVLDYTPQVNEEGEEKSDSKEED